jgi:hypothetical protein
MPDPITVQEVEELEGLSEIQKTQGWKFLKILLNKHRFYCIEQSNKHLERHEDRKAGEWLARSKEPQRLISLVSNRKQELSDKREKGSE